MNRKSTFSLTDTAILAAFCMFLSIIEYLIPKPVPFMRLGLAHLPVLISLLILPVRGTLLLTLLKILGQGLVNGSLFSYIFLFSASGSITSSLVMLSVYRLFERRVSLAGVSVAGATASNIVQIILARQFIFGDAAILIAPPFLAIGIISSVLLGLFALKFSKRSEWVKTRLEDKISQKITKEHLNPGLKTAGGLFPRYVFICGLLSIPAFVFQAGVLTRFATTVLFVIYSVIAGKRFRLLPNLAMAGGVIAANLLTPFGRILYEFGSFRITEGALEAGMGKALLLIGLIYISRSSVRNGLRLPGRIGSMLSLVFYYFEQLTEGERVKSKHIFSQLDQRLTALSSLKENPSQTGNAADRAGVKNYIASAIPMLAAWIFLTAEIIFKTGT